MLWREVASSPARTSASRPARASPLQQILPFGLIVLLLFAFALDPDRGVLDRVAPGLFWVTVLLAALLAVSRSFTIEADNGARDGLRLSGLDGPALFLGKAAAVAVQLLALEVVLARGVVVLYGIQLDTLVPLVLATLAATVGVAATGTLYGVLAAGLRVRETLVPLLLLPVVAPVLLGATRAWEAAIDGIPSDAWPWVALLAVFAVLFTGDRDARLRAAPGGSMSEAGLAGTRLLKPQVARVLGGLTLAAVVVLAPVRALGRPARRDAGRRPTAHVPPRARGLGRVPRVRRHRHLVRALAVAPHPVRRVGPRRRRVGRARRDSSPRSPSCSVRCGASRCGASGGRGTPASSRPRCCSSCTSATSRCVASRPRPRPAPSAAPSPR